MLLHFLRYYNRRGPCRSTVKRRTMWLTAITTAVAVGIPLAAFPCASSAIVPIEALTFASPFGPTMISSEPQDPPSAGAVAVLTRQGLSPTRASQAIGVQSKVGRTHLVSKIEDAMAHAYAGAWFENAAAQLHIGVTSPSSWRTAEQIVAREGLTGDVTTTPVRSTWAQLLAAQERWSKRLANLFAHEEVMTAINSQRNALSVGLSPLVPPRERAALERDAARSSVNVSVEVLSSPQPIRMKPEARPTCERVFTPGSAFCERTLVSGVGWRCSRAAGRECDTTEAAAVGAQCTAGPMLISGTETYMLTAGHCFGERSPEGEPLRPEAVRVRVLSEYVGGGREREIGREGSWLQNRERDIAEVRINPRGEFTEPLPTPVPAFVAEWGQLPERPHEVTGEEPSVEGQANCHEGMTSGEQCGMVEEVSTETLGIRGLVEDTACSEGGDSGGPYFRRDIISGEEFIVLMQGTHVGKVKVRTEPEIRCRAIPEFEEEVQTNSNTQLTGLRSIGTPPNRIAVSWEVIGRGIEKRTSVTEIREVRRGEFTVVISRAATTRERVRLKFKQFYRAFYEPMRTILATFRGQRLLTAANEVRKPRIRAKEGKALTRKAYTSTSGASTIETKAGSKLTCSADSGNGEASGESTGTAKITLTGCEGFGGRCHTAGAAEGEIALIAKYTLAFVNGAKDEVGLLLELTEATIECGKNCVGRALETLKLRGTGIGPVTPIDEEVVPSKKFTVAFSQSRGVQSPTEYENERGTKVKAILEMEGSGTKVFAFEETGISDTDELLFEEAAEIEG
jgi:Trypsin